MALKELRARYFGVGRLGPQRFFKSDETRPKNRHSVLHADEEIVSGSGPVCTENLVHFDLMTESLNVGRDGRADSLPLEPGCLALQVQEPA
jgi:hypothetical protein